MNFWLAAFLVMLISLVGSVIQRVSGFGFGIFAMMFLPYIAHSYGEANALSNLISVGMTVYVALSLLKYVHWKNILFPAIGFAALAVPAVFFMISQTDTVLLILLGSVLILLSVYFMLFSEKVHINPTWYGGLLCGGLSGIMGGLFSMGGPPVVVYFMQSENRDKHVYLATIQMYFAITNIFSTGVKACRGLVTPSVLLLSIGGIIGMAGGVFLGKLIFDRLNAKTLRRIVYCVMAVSGVVNIMTAVIRAVKL